MVARFHAHSLIVSNNQSVEFFDSIWITLHAMTKLQLHKVYFLNQRLQAVNVSYNEIYKPFFGFTAGLTPDEDRVYLPENIWLFDRIGEFLDELNLPTPGGRVAISSHMVKKRLDDYSLNPLCVFDWQGDNGWVKCKYLLRGAQSQA